jgi:hypothetical protein
MTVLDWYLRSPLDSDHHLRGGICKIDATMLSDTKSRATTNQLPCQSPRCLVRVSQVHAPDSMVALSVRT